MRVFISCHNNEAKSKKIKHRTARDKVEDPVGPVFINDVDAKYSFWLEGAALNEFRKEPKPHVMVPPRILERHII